MKNRSQPISRVLSRTTIHLGRASPHASCDLPGSDAGRAKGSLFGLAPGGVYPAVHVTANAVRSYRTFSPLPAIGPKGRPAGGMFSVALSVGSRRPDVIWHLALWSPDFPPPRTTCCPEGASGRHQDRGCPANSRAQLNRSVRLMQVLITHCL